MTDYDRMVQRLNKAGMHHANIWMFAENALIGTKPQSRRYYRPTEALRTGGTPAQRLEAVVQALESQREAA